MKKVLLPIVASALFAGSAFSKVSAGELKYFGSINVQHSNPTTQYRSDEGNYNGAETSRGFEKNFGLGLAGGVQYNINDAFYVNAEVFANYVNNASKTHDIDTDSVAVKTTTSVGGSKQNFTYGVLSRFGYNVNDKTSAYIGVGASYGKHNVYYSGSAGDSISNNKNLLSGIAALGIATNVTASTQLYTEYQIAKANSYTVMGDTKVTFTNRSFVIGLRKFFN